MLYVVSFCVYIKLLGVFKKLFDSSIVVLACYFSIFMHIRVLELLQWAIGGRSVTPTVATKRLAQLETLDVADCTETGGDLIENEWNAASKEISMGLQQRQLYSLYSRFFIVYFLKIRLKNGTWRLLERCLCSTANWQKFKLWHMWLMSLLTSRAACFNRH